MFDGDEERLDQLLNLITYNLKEKTYMVGNPIIEEGDKCEKLIFITSGKVEISMSGQSVETLGRNDFIG